MLNYKFREATQDFDVILRTVSGISDVITRFADENELPRDWMNRDFIKTTSYSAKLTEVSKHFCSLNNNTLEIRTVSGKYLIAMKIRAHREYRNDISDVAGILIEEREKGNNISFPDVNDAYVFLYEEAIDSNVEKVVRELFDKDTDELKKIYAEQNEAEASIGTKVESYIDDGADIICQKPYDTTENENSATRGFSLAEITIFVHWMFDQLAAKLHEHEARDRFHNVGPALPLITDIELSYTRNEKGHDAS